MLYVLWCVFTWDKNIFSLDPFLDVQCILLSITLCYQSLNLFLFQPWTTGQPVRHSQGGIYTSSTSIHLFFFQAKQTTPCFKFCPLGRFSFTIVLQDDMYWTLILCTISDSLEPPLILLAPYQCWVTTPYTHFRIWMRHHAAGHGIQISEQRL